MTNYNKKYYFFIIMALMIFILSTTVSFAYNDTLKYKNLVGSDRYDTSVKISKELYPNNSKNVVIAIGTSNIDGIVAVPLAEKLSAPILLVQKDKIPTGVKNEIIRLKATNVYIIGGSDVISSKVVTELNNIKDGNNKKLLTTITRIEGATRYTTATAIAKKINSFNNIIVCNSRDGGVNVSAVAALAAQNGIPILYNDSTSTMNTDTYKFIKNNVSKIKNIYLISNGMSSAQQKELSNLKKGLVIEKLTGKTAQDINVEMIKKLNLKYTNVTLVNNAVDAVAISCLAAKKDSMLLYTGTNLTTNQKELVKNNAITTIYYTGGGKIKGPVKEVIYTLETKKVNSNPTLEFNKSKVVFYVPHQDDEVLYYGQTIMKAIKEKGANNVFVVMITDGAGSALATKADIKAKLVDSKLLSNKNASEAETKAAFSKARDNEYMAACLALGLPKSNILFNDVSGKTRLKDGKVVAADVKATMNYFEEKYKGDVTHITYTFKFDYHKDHRALGTALNELYYDLNTRADAFSSVYFIIRANYDNQNGSTSGVKLITLKEITNGDKLRNALNCYIQPFKSTDLTKVRIGIGGISVKSEFESVITKVTNKTLTTQIHLPY